MVVRWIGSATIYFSAIKPVNALSPPSLNRTAVTKMGEHAEMMLDGTCCEACGEFIGNPIGYPRYCCKACEPENHRPITLQGALRRSLKPHQREETRRHLAKAHVCDCGKRFRFATALAQHQRDKHPAIPRLEPQP
jgi:hypothetical protein